MNPRTSVVVLFGIPGLALLVVGLVCLGVLRMAGPRRALWVTLGSALWLAYAATLGLSGVLTHFEDVPPRLLLLLGPTIALPFALGLSRVGRALSAAPMATLVGFQAFRLPLELIMHQAALDGTMPSQMTYTGSNFDIVTGGSAIVVAALAARGLAPRWLLLTWNALGSLLLVTIIVIALASLPRFAAFGSEPARLNTWVAHFPFVWLPAGLVSAAILGHVLLWRRLFGTSSLERRGDGGELLL